MQPEYVGSRIACQIQKRSTDAYFPLPSPSLHPPLSLLSCLMSVSLPLCLSALCSLLSALCSALCSALSLSHSAATERDTEHAADGLSPALACHAWTSGRGRRRVPRQREGGVRATCGERSFSVRFSALKKSAPTQGKTLTDSCGVRGCGVLANGTAVSSLQWQGFCVENFGDNKKEASEYCAEQRQNERQ